MFEFFFYSFKIYISGVVEGVSRGKVLLMLVFFRKNIVVNEKFMNIIMVVYLRKEKLLFGWKMLMEMNVFNK